jgi:hypothetical protein
MMNKAAAFVLLGLLLLGIVPWSGGADLCADDSSPCTGLCAGVCPACSCCASHVAVAVVRAVHVEGRVEPALPPAVQTPRSAAPRGVLHVPKAA